MRRLQPTDESTAQLLLRVYGLTEDTPMALSMPCAVVCQYMCTLVPYFVIAWLCGRMDRAPEPNPYRRFKLQPQAPPLTEEVTKRLTDRMAHKLEHSTACHVARPLT
jgi:hypothetical protein